MDNFDEMETNGYTQDSATVLPLEVDFCSSLASHSCAFRFCGASSLSSIPNIIEEGRAALGAATAGAVFYITGSLSFGIYVLFSLCLPATTVPYIPAVGATLYLLIILPGLSLAMSLTNSDATTMTKVPPKNDASLVFPSRKEGFRLYLTIILQAIPPALLPQLLHLICFGELLLADSPLLMEIICGNASSWVDLVRCQALEGNRGSSWTSSGITVFSSFLLCIIAGSFSMARRYDSFLDQPPWKENFSIVWVTTLSVGLTGLYAAVASRPGTAREIPGYTYILVVSYAMLCLIWNETWKRLLSYHERRAENLRRLQFETRLGAWSPR